ncbi:MAG TPA: FKBP-type peptidyl-prolyl cis-trans isomerase [Vicinamibacteria bacterium]|nr:FKBP-type peptidyl-prolyl cis-trans isomerase [Vicinamibacteria bacterium]
MNRRLSPPALVPIALLLAGCGSSSDSTPTTTPSTQELVIQDLVVGTGPVATTGDTLTVNYVGRFTNGTQFDSSYDRGVPYTFQLGAHQVIAGWDQGLVGMRVGGTRRLTIPPALAYGASGSGVIPPNATLVFDIELLSIAGK